MGIRRRTRIHRGRTGCRRGQQTHHRWRRWVPSRRPQRTRVATHCHLPVFHGRFLWLHPVASPPWSRDSCPARHQCRRARRRRSPRMGRHQAEDHSDSTVRFRRNSTRICPRTRPDIRVDPFLDGLNVTHTRNFRQFGRVLTVKLTELHIETSDFSQVLGFHGLDLTRICGTNPVTWPETS